MRNLTRIAFVFAFAACGNPSNDLIPDPCTADPTLPECQPPVACEQDADCDLSNGDPCLVDLCEASVCGVVDVCNSIPSGEAVVFANDNGSMFFGARYDDSTGFGDFITAEDEQLASIPQNSCIETPFPDSEGDPTLRSMGNVQLLRGGTILVDLAPNDADPIYEEILAAGTANLGEELDLVLTGSTVVDANTFPGLLAIPPAFPAFDFVDPNTGVLALSPTLSFNPFDVDHVIVSFNFVEGQNVVSISCRGDGNSGSATIDGTTFARLPQSGSVSIRTFNRRVRIISTADGVARSFRATAQTNKNVQYQKL